jgi:CRISPR-associated protein Cas2
MIIISFDISDDKLRRKFVKYITKFGYRLQYSVYQIDHSARILKNITNDITNKFEKLFGQSDSIIIFNLSEICKITRFGYAKNDNHDIIIV